MLKAILLKLLTLIGCDHVLGCDYDRNLLFVTLNSSSSNLNSVQLKLSAFYVDYIVATSIIPYMEISHDLVTK